MAAQDGLVSPRRLVGRDVEELLTHYWPHMAETRRRSEANQAVVNGEDTFKLPETFQIAGAQQYISDLPHPRTVPLRVLEGLIADRPHLGVPLGPKGLGITGQRLTTRVEEPLNAICEDRVAGFQWDQMAAIGLYEGWAAGITVVDPAGWQKYASTWDDSEADSLREQMRSERDDVRRSELAREAGRATDAAKRRHELSLAVHRARNVPIRHRALSIRNCAPIFGPNMSVEGLIVSQEYSTSWLARRYQFGLDGLATPTGRSIDGDGSTSIVTSHGMGTLTMIEAWLYDEDGLPYVSYVVKGPRGIVSERWRDGEPATIDLHQQFGLDRLPIHWEFFLGNPGETNPDKRAMGFVEPFIRGWRSVRAKLTANNVAILFGSYPILLEEQAGPGALADSIEDDEPSAPDIMPLKIVQARPGTKLSQLQIQAIGAEAYEQIRLEMGLSESEAPGRSNKNQSGFSQSLAAGFEELALTTVKKALKRLYEAHGSYVLEAGKRLPELGEKRGGTAYPPISVFASTDVPLNDSGDRHRDPMDLDPSLIDETFTVVARYASSMSIPEAQQSMEAVARNLKTRRQHLEDTGDEHPEMTELELLLEAIRGTPAWQQYALKLMAKAQGAEELEQIAAAQNDGLVNEDGMPTALSAGVRELPAAMAPGQMAALTPGAPGVPEGGSVTGMSAPSYGQSALAGVASGSAMTGPINRATQAGGVLPPTLPVPRGVV